MYINTFGWTNLWIYLLFASSAFSFTTLPPPDFETDTTEPGYFQDETTTMMSSAEVTTRRITRTGRRYTPLDEADEEFCYTRSECGPGSELWDGLCEEGEKQSPINIIRNKVVPSSWGGPIYLNPDYRMPQEFFVMNSGHTVSVMLNADLSSRATIVVGGSEKLMHGGTFAFAQVHFHWGSIGSQGSEHSLDGQRFAMEGHFVHYNTKYENFTIAMTKKDGLAIFGVFFQETHKDNPAFEPIISQFDSARDSRKMFPGSGLHLTRLVPVMLKTPTNAYHYHGSLTTPDCLETVTWIVFEKRLPISTRQLESFRSLIDSNGDKMVDNFRPTQPINRRKIRKISVYCGADCEETELQEYKDPLSHRMGKLHFPFVIIGPQIRRQIGPLEILLSSINISIYLLTISWIIALMKQSYTLW